MPVGDPSFQNVDYSIRAFSKTQWEILSEESQHEIFSQHTVYVFGDLQQKLLPKVKKFDALSLAHWFDLSAKRSVHGKCHYIILKFL